MFGAKKYELKKEKKENEEKLKKLHGREVQYASRRDNNTYVETVIGKNGIITVKDDIFSLICNDRIIFNSPLKDLFGSDLMSLDGIVLTRYGNGSENEDKIIIYYKYYRKVD